MADEIQYAAPIKKRKKEKKEPHRDKNKTMKTILNVIIVLFSALFVFSAVKIVIAQRAYREVDRQNEEIREEYEPEVRPYVPSEATDSHSGDKPHRYEESSSAEEPSSDLPSEVTSYLPSEVTSDPTSEPAEEPKKQSKKETPDEKLISLRKSYPDVVGWLKMDGNHINYVFVQGKDNEEYVRANLNKKYLISGTLFLDYESSKDFSSFNTVMYGHNMRNDSMFGDLDRYEKKSYFDSHKTGTVILPNTDYHLEVFAFLVVKSTDPILYDCNIETDEEKQAFLDYAKKNARQYRDIGVTIDDKILTLSTCAYEFDGARCILLCKAIEY